jgi:hypothetical protein
VALPGCLHTRMKNEHPLRARTSLQRINPRAHTFIFPMCSAHTRPHHLWIVTPADEGFFLLSLDAARQIETSTLSASRLFHTWPLSRATQKKIGLPKMPLLCMCGGAQRARIANKLEFSHQI